MTSALTATCAGKPHPPISGAATTAATPMCLSNRPPQRRRRFARKPWKDVRSKPSATMAKAECDRTKPTQAFMAKLLKIAKTEDVPPGQAAAFTIEGQKIALFNVEGTYYAIGDTCTHRGGPLSEGDVQGTKVTCPWHGADFDLKTGAVLGLPAQNGVPSYKVVVEGDDIKVEV